MVEKTMLGRGSRAVYGTVSTDFANRIHYIQAIGIYRSLPTYFFVLILCIMLYCVHVWCLDYQYPDNKPNTHAHSGNPHQNSQ